MLELSWPVFWLSYLRALEMWGLWVISALRHPWLASWSSVPHLWQYCKYSTVPSNWWQLVERQFQYRTRERQLQQRPHNRHLNSLDSHMTRWSVQLVVCTNHKELTDTAMVPAVGHWPFATEALVWTKASACRLVEGWVVHWDRFFCSYCCFYVSLSFIPTMFHTHLFICYQHQQLIILHNAHQK